MEKTFNLFKINLNKNQQDLFEKYYQILIEYNNKFNITAITDREEVIVKHFVDSSLFVDKLSCKNLIDVGSGGGFPAIPIKILNEDINLTLLEATGKKCDFLSAVVKELNLKNVSILNGRAEDFAKDSSYREKFDACSARAVARLNTLCEYCMPFVKVKGKFYAFKGQVEEELIEAENAIKILGGKITNVYERDLFDAKRTLVEIEKIKNTDKKYPRGNGKERKCPL